MAVTYTNRKGITYTLCRVTTKVGKAHYAFTRPARGRIGAMLPPYDPCARWRGNSGGPPARTWTGRC